MSETKHSPEPWFGYDGSHFASTEDGKSVWVGKTALNSDARRIIACVNALAGVPTEALESGALGKALASAEKALGVLAAVSGASRVDTTEWDLHRGMATVRRDDMYAALRSLGRLK